MTKQLSKDIKFQNFILTYTKIKSHITKFKTSPKTFSGSKKELLKWVKNYMANYNSNAYEDELMNLATDRFLTEHSLVDAYIVFLKDKESSKEVVSSTMQIIYQFYMATMLRVLESDAMVNFAKILQNELSEPSSNATVVQHSSITKEFRDSFKESMRKLQDIQHRSTHLHFDSENVPKDVKLKIVIQYFWQNERELSGREDTCKYKCHDFTYRSYSNDGCYGRLRDCKMMVDARWAPKYALAEYQYKSVS